MAQQLDLAAVQAQLDAYGEQVLAALNPAVAGIRQTRDWPLARCSTAVFIVAAYLAFVMVGPLFVRLIGKREPYALKFSYNLVQMALCSYMTIEALLVGYRNGYTVVCNNAAMGGSMPMANLLWLFYVSKVLDFFDTFFIILGQKSAQLSILHVYHHSTIFLVYWANLAVNYDGDVYFTILLNGLIHAVMYTYYFVSMHTKDVWWKKYVTQMQLLQFMCMMTQAGTIVFGCKANPAGLMSHVYFWYILSLFLLFVNFYVRAYKKPAKVAATKKKA